MKQLQKLMPFLIFSLMIISCNQTTTDGVDVNSGLEKTEVVTISKEGKTKDIRLDYHEKYGVVKANEFPMNPKGVQGEPTLEQFLEKSDIRKEEIANYRISKSSFSGIGLAEHRMDDGNVIQVPHRYDNQSVYRLDGELVTGERFVTIIIIVCSNGMVIILIF
ncbi:hypothetical protein [Tenacibaculum amylolyticum]|uniref:hypothetical protein n=1 Tax=Tenacibaculum amylolyticum TaxID=104269 RepID=UPI003893CB64